MGGSKKNKNFLRCGAPSDAPSDDRREELYHLRAERAGEKMKKKKIKKEKKEKEEKEKTEKKKEETEEKKEDFF